VLPLAANKKCQHNHVQSGEKAEDNQCVYGSTEGNVPSAAPTSSPEITSFDLNKNPAGQLWADSCRGIRKSATRSNRAVPPQQSTSLLVTSSVRFSTPSAGHRKRGGRYVTLMKRQKPWRGLWRAVGWWCTTTNENTGLRCGL
jgi:hypothetical protein